MSVLLAAPCSSDWPRFPFIKTLQILTNTSSIELPRNIPDNAPAASFSFPEDSQRHSAVMSHHHSLNPKAFSREAGNLALADMSCDAKNLSSGWLIDCHQCGLHQPCNAKSQSPYLYSRIVTSHWITGSSGRIKENTDLKCLKYRYSQQERNHKSKLLNWRNEVVSERNTINLQFVFLFLLFPFVDVQSSNQVVGIQDVPILQAMMPPYCQWCFTHSMATALLWQGGISQGPSPLRHNHPVQSELGAGAAWRW